MYRTIRFGIRSSNTIRNPHGSWCNQWPSPHVGKYWKRALHKAIRSYTKGYGRLRSVSHATSEVDYRTW
jgi:hypothetical protein